MKVINKKRGFEGVCLRWLFDLKLGVCLGWRVQMR